MINSLDRPQRTMHDTCMNEKRSSQQSEVPPPPPPKKNKNKNKKQKTQH